MNVHVAFLGSQPGFFEMFLIFTAVLLLFGADSLPKFARQFGRLMEELRRASQDFKDQVSRADLEVKDMTRDVWQDDHTSDYDYDADHDDYHHDDYHHDDYHHDDYHHDDYHHDDPHHDSHDMDHHEEDHELHYKDDHGESAIAQAAKTVAREAVTEQVVDSADSVEVDAEPGEARKLEGDTSADKTGEVSGNG